MWSQINIIFRIRMDIAPAWIDKAMQVKLTLWSDALSGNAGRGVCIAGGAGRLSDTMLQHEAKGR